MYYMNFFSLSALKALNIMIYDTVRAQPFILRKISSMSLYIVLHIKIS